MDLLHADQSKPLSFSQLVKVQNLPYLLSISLFFTMSFALMEQTIGLFIERAWLANIIDASIRHSEAAALTAYFLVAVGIGASIVQGGLIGKLTKRWGEVRLCQAGILIVGLGKATQLTKMLRSTFVRRWKISASRLSYSDSPMIR